MVVRSPGEHQVGNRPIRRQNLFLVTAEVVERCRGAAQIPQFGHGVVGSGEQEVLVGGRPGDRGDPAGVMRHRRLDDGTLLRARVVNAHVTIAGAGGDEPVEWRVGNVDENLVAFER